LNPEGRALRTLFFVEGFWPLIGGVETITADLTASLADRGHEILVITDRAVASLPEHDRLDNKVEIRRIPFVQALRERDIEQLAAARRTMNQIFRDFRPDLIHATFTGAGLWLLPRRDATPLILSFHGSWPTIDFGALGGVFAQAVERAAWVTACSQSALEDLLATAPQIRGRCSVILNGLDPRFDGEPPEQPPGPPVLFCSGRIVRDKGLDIAIDALVEVTRHHPDVRLVVAGDGPALNELVARSASVGLADHIDFPGWVPPERVPSFLGRASAVLIPSRLEGFGLVALEAALSARPAVATRVGGLPEAVLDGETGILVAPDDPTAMADAVLRLLADPGAARRLGQAARRRASALFNSRRHADEWDALYKRVAFST
jgi:glycogen synthase